MSLCWWSASLMSCWIFESLDCLNVWNICLNRWQPLAMGLIGHTVALPDSPFGFTRLPSCFQVAVCGRFPSNFIHQVIIITGLNTTMFSVWRWPSMLTGHKTSTYTQNPAHKDLSNNWNWPLVVLIWPIFWLILQLTKSQALEVDLAT